MQRQRERRRKELEWRLNWIIGHPDKVDPEIRPAAIDFLKSSIAELDREEMKNTRPARRASLRHRVRSLVIAILTQTPSMGK